MRAVNNTNNQAQRDWFTSKKIFFTNLPEELQVKEVCKNFKQYVEIKDILLPTKKDRFGKRFGFVSTKNNLHARHLISVTENLTFRGENLRLDWARNMKKKHLGQDSTNKEVPQIFKSERESQHEKWKTTK